MSHALGVTILLMLAATASAAPATRPAAAGPDFWLDRAAAELPAVRAAGRRSLPTSFLWEENLATMIFQARRSDADRARMVEVARYHEQRPPPEDTPAGNLEPVLTAAMLYSRAGRDADARRLLPAVKRLAGVREVLATSDGVLLVRDRLDDLPAEEAATLDLIDLLVLAKQMNEDGRPERARKHATLARAAAAPAAGDQGVDAYRVVQTLSEIGDFAAARAVAAGMPRDSHLRAEAFGQIAWEHHRRGDPPRRLAALREGLKAAGEADGFHRQIGLHDLMLDAAGMLERTGMAEAADSLAVALPRDAAVDAKDVQAFIDHVKALAELAGVNALLDGARRAQYSTFVARAEAMSDKLGPQERAMAWLWVSEAKACAGDKAGVAEAVARSKAAFDLGEIDEGTRYQAAAFGYLEAGDLDAALAETEAIGRGDKTLRNWPLEFICPALARAGRYADAERAAASMTADSSRLSAHRLIVVERVKAGKLDGLARWIDGHGSPNERALLNLAAAQQMLGVEGKGRLRHLRPHDKWRV